MRALLAIGLLAAGFASGYMLERAQWRRTATAYARVREGSAVQVLLARARETAFGPADPYPGDRLDLARLLMDMGDYESAAVEWEAALRRHLSPDEEARGLLQLAACEAYVGRGPEAVDAFRRATRRAPGVAKGAAEFVPLAAHVRGRAITPDGDSVLLSFMWGKWGLCAPPAPPGELLVHAALSSPSADTWTASLRMPLMPGQTTDSLYGLLGQGMPVQPYPGVLSGTAYRDSKGVRLLYLRGSDHTLDTVILSQESKLPAQLVGRDLGALRARRGVGLGASQGQVEHVLGEPAIAREFGEYRVLWYFSEPGMQRSFGAGHPSYRYGYADAYALKGPHVVEVYLHRWWMAPATF